MARTAHRLSMAVLLAAGMLLVVPAANAGYWTQMFVFGDSLSDSGNAASLSQTPAPPVVGLISYFPPSAPNPFPGEPSGIPYDFRFSNGPVAAEYLAQMLGLPPSAPAWPTGNASNPNYAVGGAMTGTRTIMPTPTTTLTSGNYNWLVDNPPGLQSLYPAVQNTGLDAQVALFAARLNTSAVGFDPNTTLFTIWGGANDIFLGLDLVAGGATVDFDALIASSAINIANRIGELAFLGGMHFVVINLPDLGMTPLALSQDTATQALLTGISQGFNFALATALDSFQGSGLDIIEFDAFSEFHSLIAEAKAQGFNVSEPCYSGDASIPIILAGCPGYIYFDSVHPTTYAHSIIAASLYEAVPEPGVLALLAAALLGMAWGRRLRKGV